MSETPTPRAPVEESPSARWSPSPDREQGASGVERRLVAGRYEIEREVGRGGMGVVYRARDTELGRAVAVKVIVSAGFCGPDPEDLQRFVREARSTAALSHPGIVRVFDAGRHGTTPFIVMDYIEGSSLAELLQRRPLDFRRAAKITRDLCLALEHAHAHGIVHRDVKPENILFDRTGRTLLSDFGLARARDAQTLTGSGIVVGTPAYMAPEQALGSPRHPVGPAADIWAAGAVLYRCITGQPPFTGTGTVETMHQVLTEEVTPPRRIDAQIPPALEAIVMRCLQKVPADRFESARALAGALHRFVRQTRTRPAADGFDADDEGGDARAWALPIGAAVIVLLAWAAWWAFGSRPGAVAPPPLAVRSKPTSVEAAPPPPPAPKRSPIEPAPVEAVPEDEPAGAADALAAARARARDLVAQAAELRKLQQLERALPLLDEAVAADPELASARSERGAVKADLGDMPGAREDLDRAIELDPSVSVNYANRGTVRASLGDAVGSLEDLKKAVEMEPRWAPYWMALSRGHLAVGDARGAIAAIDRALALDPLLPEALTVRAILRSGGATLDVGGGGVSPEALEDFARAVEIAPGNPTFQKNHAIALMAAGRTEEAFAAIERALALAPDRPDIVVARGQLHAESGAPIDALADFSRALELKPDDPEALLGRGMLARRHGRGADRGRTDLERFLKVADPADPRRKMVERALGLR